jgi:hypothetical protein
MSIESRPTEIAAASPLSLLVKGASVIGTLIWVTVLLVFISAISGPNSGGLNALGPLLALIVATPIFFISVLPALLFSFLGGRSGATVGAGFLLGGLALVTVFAMPMFR